MSVQFDGKLRKIAVIGNYQPRQCGIATFTTDLSEALAAAAPQTDVFALPINDREQGYLYPPRVRLAIPEKDLVAYRHAAEFLNINNVDVVCVQHEYGIFGGIAGSHILALLRDLRMPIVTTLHTVLRRPDFHQRRVLEELARLSDRLVVMSERSVESLQEIYGLPADKIALIPHGIPEVPPDPKRYKARIGLTGKQVLLTFGLLSPSKGIEHVIAALPEIVKRHSNTMYVVLGATHPHIRQQEGETYRLRLQRQARELGVERNVVFYNQFVSLEELRTFIGATDLYITPYSNPEQSVSGTLSYVVGNGCPVISTPYWYAEELLADGRGVLVPFKSSEAIAKEAIYLLDNPNERRGISARAWALGREMIWPEVARRYLDLFDTVRTESARPDTLMVNTLDDQPQELPPLRIDHLRRMTDDTGMLQHAIFSVPNYHEGYTTDDNARALIAAVLFEDFELDPPHEASILATRYLAFLWHAFNPDLGRFRNFMDYDRRWLEKQGSEDSHARTLWALGTVVGRSEQPQLRDMATHLFYEALPAVESFKFPHPWAFALLGIHEYLRRFSGDRAVERVRDVLADRLLAAYREHATEDWYWFRDRLTYDSARLPHALLLTGQNSQRDELIEVGLESLSWLVDLHYPEGAHFVPIGNNGFYRQGHERARFDQQPIEANAMIAASLAAYALTDDATWHWRAQQTFEWFLGNNDAGLPLYDAATGGCCDGLEPGKINRNQGAESTLAFLLSLLELRLAEQPIELARNGD
jgi:glycosyltransferase involved in cell wall biosynthesis